MTQPGHLTIMALFDMPISDEIPWDEGDLSRLVLDDPPIGQELFREGIPRPEICPNSPSWDLRPGASDASHRIFEPETPSSAGLGNFGSQELIYPIADARFFNERWNVPFPSEAGSEGSTGIGRRDANIGVPSLGESFPEQQDLDMLNLDVKALTNIQGDYQDDTDPVDHPRSSNKARPSCSHRKRRAFTCEKRTEVAAVRAISACVRCQISKVKCGLGEPCDHCRRAGGTANPGMCFRGRLRDVVLHKTCVPRVTTTASGNHVTLVLRCAPDGTSLYALTPPIQMNIRCQQSSNIPTDYTIPASQLTQTARNLEVLIADYQEGIWASVCIGQNTLVGCTMTEALRQAKNYPELQEALRIAVISRLVVAGFSIEAAQTANFCETPSPYASRTPAPSNLGAQVDSLLIEKMRQLQARLVTRLKSRMDSPKSGHQQHLYAIYLIIFVLLYNLEVLYQDQMLKMQPQQAYSSSATAMMEDWEASATILLAHFHVICKGKAPFSHAGILQCRSLDAEALEYVSAISSHVHAREEDLRDLSFGAPGNPLVWISRLLLPPPEG